MGMRLDLACGQNRRKGYMGVDINPDVDNDPSVGFYTCDLTKFPWTNWETSIIEAVWCSHYVEHAPDLVAFMNEVWRICQPDALVEIQHPYQHSNRAWQDPTHVRALNEDSWRYYNADERNMMGVDHYPITANFEIERIEFVLAPDMQHATRRDIRCGVNVVDDLYVVLRAIKSNGGGNG